MVSLQKTRFANANWKNMEFEIEGWKKCVQKMYGWMIFFIFKIFTCVQLLVPYNRIKNSDKLNLR